MKRTFLLIFLCLILVSCASVPTNATYDETVASFENDKNYYSKTGCGGTTATYTSNVITGYKATKSKLEITTTYAFFNGETNTIYKDYNKTISLDTYTGGSTEETTTYLDNYVKNNKDKLNTLVYTFESTNGRNYYFTGLKNNR